MADRGDDGREIGDAAACPTQSEIYRRGNVENGWKSLIMVDHAWKCQ